MELPSDLLPEETFKRHLIDELGVSEDVAILDMAACLGTTVTALAEQGQSIHDLPLTDHQVLRVQEAWRSQGKLPDHLESSGSFLQRYRELTSPTYDLRSGEVVRTIRANRNNPEETVQKKFEDDTAHVLATFLLEKFTLHPSQRPLVEQYRFARLSQKREGAFLTTKGGVRARLPHTHAGVLQIAPPIGDTLGRLGEAQERRGWENLAFVHGTNFNNSFAHYASSMIYNVPPKRIFSSSGPFSESVDALRAEMQSNGRLRKGFGAIILSSLSISGYPDNEVQAVINAAPDLLSDGGVLLINDLQQFLGRNGSVGDMIAHASQVFGGEPVQVKTSHMFQHMTQREIRQAAFVKNVAV